MMSKTPTALLLPFVLLLPSLAHGVTWRHDVDESEHLDPVGTLLNGGKAALVQTGHVSHGP